jgi:DNA (cytosine-5)-methyltransferase 1
MPKKPLTCIDLFAGCGGLSLGLEQAGFKPLLFCELNNSAAETYEANRPDRGIQSYRDIKSLTNGKLDRHLDEWKRAKIQRVDLVCGGPPCQGYSGIGHRRTHKVTREEVPSNYLYREMIRVIRKVKPRMFLFENVRGLLSGRWTPAGHKGEIWEDIRGSFERIPGYTVRWKLVHAKEYGVPQNRPRVLLVGISDELGWADSPALAAGGLLPEPSATPPDPVDVWSDIVDDDYLRKRSTDRYPEEPRSAFQLEMRTTQNGRVLKIGDQLFDHEYSQHSPRIRKKFMHMLRHAGSIPENMRTKKFAQRLITERWGLDGPNITATSLPDDFVHYQQPRSLTVREWARLQTFPDWYQFKGPRTTGGTRRAGTPSLGYWGREVPKYTQIGNAVPVRLARALGVHFKLLLEHSAFRPRSF